MVKLKPLADRVLIEMMEPREIKKGGIIIPDTAKEKPQEGKVIAVGPGKMGKDGKRFPMDVKPGNKVLYGKYSGSEIKLDDKEYMILNQDEILGIVE